MACLLARWLIVVYSGRSGGCVLRVSLIRVSLRVSPTQSRADLRCAGRGYTAGLPARPLSARGTTVLTLRNTAMDTTRRLGGMVVRVTMGHELNLVQCGGAILALVLHATVTGASRYAALGSVRWLLVLHRMFLRVSSFQRVSLWPVRA